MSSVCFDNQKKFYLHNIKLNMFVDIMVTKMVSIMRVHLDYIKLVQSFFAVVVVHAVSVANSDNATANLDNTCPTWMHFNRSSNECVCGVSHHHAVKCDSKLKQVAVLRTGCYMMTLYE